MICICDLYRAQTGPGAGSVGVERHPDLARYQVENLSETLTVPSEKVGTFRCCQLVRSMARSVLPAASASLFGRFACRMSRNVLANASAVWRRPRLSEWWLAFCPPS